jgi:5,10-methylenetetrahydromethanopterin reductase
MHFSIRLNNDLPVADYIVLAQAAEDYGFDQFWVSHDLMLRSSPVILASVAAQTRRIQLGACVLNPYSINPAEIAMLAATLDEASGCRFNLGLAAGAGDFLEWIGLRQATPLAAVRDSITAIRALLSGGPPPPSSEFLSWTASAYLRFSAPRVTPIYLGAMSPRMLALAGELADGVLPLLFPPEHYFTVRPMIESGMSRRAVSLGALDFAACIWASLDMDVAAARRALARKVAYYGHALSPLILGRLGLSSDDFAPIQHALAVDRDERRALEMVSDQMLSIGVAGQAQELISRLEPLVLAGARHLSFGPPLGPDPLSALAILGREVLPYFRNRYA